ncbi:Hypothetical predicted protein [Mytilus galloprovincialis]|uniref:YqaJ viral recombinase domain-containing protein n=1 Tax=Mytilus galloprovincialis TaxID=29158 RepID=A0A8B6GAB1_MYTGA|nr:Hypothetical predicted protein [Mytilus galloprovincialis]
MPLRLLLMYLPQRLKNFRMIFLDTHINLSADQCKQITLSTVQQSQSGLWHSERHKRITASNFGSIIRRNPSLPINKFVRNLLYSQFKGNRHTRNGILQEDTTIEEYKLKKAEDNENIYVNKTGLVIHPTNKFLAASPDGIVTSSTDGTGLIEIKNLLHSKPINLFEAANSNNFCLITINGNLKLKENHPYFFQCHGLLNVCHKPWIDFVVRTLNPYQMFIQRIYRDVDLWENTLLPKLKAFFTKALLPELASPREGKSPGIREPGIWFVDSKTSIKRKRKITSASTNRRKTKKQNPRPDTSSDSETANTQAKEPAQNRLTRGRQKQTKFVGRSIKQQWIIDEDANHKEWYKGTVVSLLKGTDGKLNAVYEVLFDGDDDVYEIDHLVADYHSGSVQFCDL